MADPALDEDEFINDEELGAPLDEPQEAVTIEQRARAMGWKPFEEYRGNPRQWSDAATFIAHGEEQLPILRDQTRRMSEKIARTDDEMAGLRNTIAEQSKAIQDAMKMARTANEQGYQRALNDLKAQQRAAVETGDMQAYDQVQAQIDAAIRERPAEAETVVAVPSPVAPQIAPETTAFIAANPWFQANPTLNKAMVKAHEAVLALRPHLTLAQQYAQAKAMVIENYPDSFPESEMPPQDTPPQQRPRRAAVMEPSPPQPRQPRSQDPFMRIEDPAERQQARDAFGGISKYDPDTTPEDYIRLYFKEANPIDLRVQRNKRK